MRKWTFSLPLLLLCSTVVFAQDEEKNDAQDKGKIPVFTNESLKPYLDKLPTDNLPAISPTSAPQLSPSQSSDSALANPEAASNQIENIVMRAGFSPDEVSVLLIDLSDGREVYALNPDVPRNPASVAKAITTGVALSMLGADYRWRTEFYAVGDVEGDVLGGHLAVKGYGNPYFVEEKLDEAIANIRARGIREIAGDLLLDGSYYQTRTERPGQFDGKGTEPYNAVPSALSINFRTAELIFHASKKGVRLSTRPKLHYTQLNNQLQLNHLPCGRGFKPKITVRSGSDAVTVSGDISSKCGTKRQSKVFTDTGDLLAGHIRRAWTESGGAFDGEWYYDVVQPSYQLIHTAYSRPLSEQIKAMNRFSNNLMTRQLFLTLGATQFGAPADESKGRQVVKQFLEQAGIATEGFFIENGSGLSRNTRMSARHIAVFLSLMARSEHANVFADSLSVAGRNGTMKRRLRNTALADNFHGKTGTLNNVKALAGYFTGNSGKQMAFVMLIHADGAKNASPVIDDVLRHLFNHSS